MVSASFGLAAEAATNAASATAPGAVGNTNADPVAAEDEAAKEKPDIKDLLALPAFTNSSGMIMVKISAKLWAGKYEVTQEEYQKVAGGNPSQFSAGRNPVESVSWNEAMAFCAKLSEVEAGEAMLPEGMAYTLPTQAQWQTLATGVDLKDAVTSSGVNRAGPLPVGSLLASAQGLHDVRGNVWELCLDPQDKAYRVARGAAWNSFIEVNLRPEFRWFTDGPDDRKNTIGFRCVLTPAGN
jgi:formylglycine-generating enzyme required for sulfatase activity